MKRSEINAICADAIAFCRQRLFELPPFAFWTPEDWRARGPECRRIVDQQLGWDITDFGSGDFQRVGLFLFTLRNGSAEDLNAPGGKTYAEKMLIVGEGQVTPTHFHWRKTEDIINRGGGVLEVELWNADGDEGLAETDVSVVCDGVERTVPAGGTVELVPGESITLPSGLYHRFQARPGAGRVLAGEVSVVNDDRTDNRFHDPVGRFPEIVEDAAPLHLLYIDYPDYYPHA